MDTESRIKELKYRIAKYHWLMDVDRAGKPPVVNQCITDENIDRLNKIGKSVSIEYYDDADGNIRYGGDPDQTITEKRIASYYEQCGFTGNETLEELEERLRDTRWIRSREAFRNFVHRNHPDLSPYAAEIKTIETATADLREYIKLYKIHEQ